MRTLSIVVALAALAAFVAPPPASGDHMAKLDWSDLDTLITDEDLDIGEEMCARPAMSG